MAASGLRWRLCFSPKQDFSQAGLRSRSLRRSIKTELERRDRPVQFGFLLLFEPHADRVHEREHAVDAAPRLVFGGLDVPRGVAGANATASLPGRKRVSAVDKSPLGDELLEKLARLGERAEALPELDDPERVNDFETPARP